MEVVSGVDNVYQCVGWCDDVGWVKVDGCDYLWSWRQCWWWWFDGDDVVGVCGGIKRQWGGQKNELSIERKILFGGEGCCWRYDHYSGKTAGHFFDGFCCFFVVPDTMPQEVIIDLKPNRSWRGGWSHRKKNIFSLFSHFPPPIEPKQHVFEKWFFEKILKCSTHFFRPRLQTQDY